MRVTSEVGPLRQVIVQPPGGALERMMPRHIHPTSPDYLLFDDLVHLLITAAQTLNKHPLVRRAGRRGTA